MKRLNIPCADCQTEIIKLTKMAPTVGYYCHERNILSLVRSDSGSISTWTVFPEMPFARATTIIQGYKAGLELISGTTGQTVN